MNREELKHHTRLHQWNEWQKWTGNSNLFNSSLDMTYLTPQKVIQIDEWRKEVGRVFKKLEQDEKTPFTRYKLSAPLYGDRDLTADPRTTRSAEPPSQRPKTARAPKRYPTTMAVRGGIANDFHTLPSHIAEISLHYSSEREELHQRQKLEEGIKTTTNNTSPATGLTRTYTTYGTIKTLNNPSDNSEEDILETSETETFDSLSLDEEAMEILSDITELHSPSMSRLNIDKNKYEAGKVGAISTSNQLLNCMTIDDCRMAYRYRPSNVRECRQSVPNAGKLEKDVENTDVKNGNMETQTNSRSNDQNQPSTKNNVSTHKFTQHRTLPNDRGYHNGQYYEEYDRIKSATVNRAMDTMINDRNIMRNIDKVHSAKYTERTIKKPETREGSAMFQRLNSALRKYINEVIEDQGQIRQRTQGRQPSRHLLQQRYNSQRQVKSSPLLKRRARILQRQS